MRAKCDVRCEHKRLGMKTASLRPPGPDLARAWWHHWYSEPSTNLVDSATRKRTESRPSQEQPEGILTALVASHALCYAICGTDLVHAATSYALCGTDLGYAATRPLCRTLEVWRPPFSSRSNCCDETLHRALKSTLPSSLSTVRAAPMRQSSGETIAVNRIPGTQRDVCGCGD
eukprot:942564-Rhodomonas_salina.3